MSLRTTGRIRKNRGSEYILTGLLRCGPCDSAMTSAQGTSRNGKRYRYYRCVYQQQHGGHCPEVRQRILDRFFTDTGALTAAEATRAQLLARIEERNAESKRLLAAFSDADTGGGKTLAKRLGEIETEVDRPAPHSARSSSRRSRSCVRPTTTLRGGRRLTLRRPARADPSRRATDSKR